MIVKKVYLKFLVKNLFWVKIPVNSKWWFLEIVCRVSKPLNLFRPNLQQIVVFCVDKWRREIILKNLEDQHLLC